MIAILGAGESGVGAALLAKKLGIDCFVSDIGQIKEKYIKELEENDIEYEQGQHTIEKILQADEIIKSPGIPNTTPVIRSAQDKNIPIISEIEFASRHTDGTFIAITGSNGKTTTTTLTYEILKNAGLNVALTGNVGRSLARTLAEHDYDYFALELSSFQLDNCYKFNPHVAIILNITPDHLDRYQYKLEKYISSKLRIVQNHQADDYFIYWKQDPNIINHLKNNPIPSHHLTFTLKGDSEANAYLNDEQIEIKLGGRELTIAVNKLRVNGKHNILNVMAASLAAMTVGVENKDIVHTLRTFSGIEHRLEYVTTVSGVTFINDSKATNVNSVWYALEAMNTPLILILGGIDKGNDYSLIAPLVEEKVKAIVALGKNNSKIIKAFGESKPVYETSSAREAVDKAYELARPGYTVLLSPACASFDLFDNYVDRGNRFKQAIFNLKQKVNAEKN